MDSKSQSYDVTDGTYVGLRSALSHRAEALRLWSNAETEAALKRHVGEKPAVMPVSQDWPEKKKLAGLPRTFWFFERTKKRAGVWEVIRGNAELEGNRLEFHLQC